MSINWRAIGQHKFNVRDPEKGFWAEEGFTRYQERAKSFTYAELTTKELKTIEVNQCQPWLANT